MLPQDYQAVAAWGAMLGSQFYYIRREQDKALAANAPLDALYETDTPGVWRTLRDLEGTGQDPVVWRIKRAIEAMNLARGLGTDGPR